MKLEREGIFAEGCVAPFPEISREFLSLMIFGRSGINVIGARYSWRVISFELISWRGWVMRNVCIPFRLLARGNSRLEHACHTQRYETGREAECVRQLADGDERNDRAAEIIRRNQFLPRTVRNQFGHGKLNRTPKLFTRFIYERYRYFRPIDPIIANIWGTTFLNVSIRWPTDAFSIYEKEKVQVRRKNRFSIEICKFGKLMRRRGFDSSAFNSRVKRELSRNVISLYPENSGNERDLFRDWKPILFGNLVGMLSSVPSNAFVRLPVVSSYSSSRQILSKYVVKSFERKMREKLVRNARYFRFCLIHLSRFQFSRETVRLSREFDGSGSLLDISSSISPVRARISSNFDRSKRRKYPRSVHLTKSWQGDRIAINKRRKRNRRGKGKKRARDSAWPLKMSARNATPFPWNRNMTVRFLRHVCRLSSRFLVNTLHLLIYEASDNAGYDSH